LSSPAAPSISRRPRIRRNTIRAKRLGGEPKAAPGTGDFEVKNGRFRCCCGCDLGSVTDNWKNHARTNVVDPSSLGRHMRTHAELEIREHVCPYCGSLLETEIARKTEASLVTVSLAV
jgi:N-methylhydantoinase B